MAEGKQITIEFEPGIHLLHVREDGSAYCVTTDTAMLDERKPAERAWREQLWPMLTQLRENARK